METAFLCEVCMFTHCYHGRSLGTAIIIRKMYGAIYGFVLEESKYSSPSSADGLNLH